jgi:pyridoxine 4-dehydrogenase
MLVYEIGDPMTATVAPAGAFTPSGTDLKLNRIGYGAIQLTGPIAWGPPNDHAGALAVLREAVRCGVNHIDTSDYYGPHIANQIIKEALHPYPAGLTIVTKVGARRGPDKSWPKAISRRDLIDAVHDNLRNLGLDVLDVVNLRLGGQFGPDDSSVEAPLSVLAELRQRGLIRHIGLSNISRAQFEEGSKIASIVCVQNHYNLAYRIDDNFIDDLAARQIAYVPFFPLGGFRPLNSPILDSVAQSLGATTRQVALAWLLQRSPNILLIAGTSSVEHLHENFVAGALQLPPEAVAQLDGIAAAGQQGAR